MSTIPAPEHWLPKYRLGIVVCTAVLGAVAAIAVSGVMQQPRSEDHRVWLALQNDVQPGDTVDSVQTVLGPGEVTSGSDAPDWMRRLFDWDSPSTAIEDADLILSYRVVDELGTTCGYHLQFRDVALINHDAQEYVVYPDPTLPSSMLDM